MRFTGTLVTGLKPKVSALTISALPARLIVVRGPTRTTPCSGVTLPSTDLHRRKKPRRNLAVDGQTSIFLVLANGAAGPGSDHAVNRAVIIALAGELGLHGYGNAWGRPRPRAYCRIVVIVRVVSVIVVIVRVRIPVPVAVR